MRRLLVAMVAALVLLFSVGLQVRADAGIDGGTNAKRAENGLAPLATSATLTSLAAQRAAQVATREATEGWGLWLHEYWWWDASGCAGIGENLAFNYVNDSGWVVEAWYNSTTGHRENMLGDFDVQGSATFTRSDGAVFFVQLFGNDCGGYAPAPAPAPAVAPAAPQTAPAAQKPAPVTLALPDTSMAIEP